MEIIAPAPKPETVITYTFWFVLSQKPFKVDVYPKQGDEVTINPDTHDFFFNFPRIKFNQVVVARNVTTFSKEETERLFIDAIEMQKKMAKEIREDIVKRTEEEAERRAGRRVGRSLPFTGRINEP